MILFFSLSTCQSSWKKLVSSFLTNAENEPNNGSSPAWLLLLNAVQKSFVRFQWNIHFSDFWPDMPPFHKQDITLPLSLSHTHTHSLSTASRLQTFTLAHSLSHSPSLFVTFCPFHSHAHALTHAQPHAPSKSHLASVHTKHVNYILILYSNARPKHNHIKWSFISAYLKTYFRLYLDFFEWTIAKNWWSHYNNKVLTNCVHFFCTAVVLLNNSLEWVC